MKHATKFILFLIIFNIFLLTACGGQQSTDATAQPNLDYLVQFNADGSAVLRGYYFDGHSTPPSNGRPNMFFTLHLPAKVDGIKSSISIPFTLLYETVVSSSTVKQTDVQRYFISNPDSYMFYIFRNRPLVEVTFRKNGTEFEALSIHEVAENFTLFQKQVNIDGLFYKDTSSQWIAMGSIDYNNNRNSIEEISWEFSRPIPMQGIEAEVIVEVESTPDTKIVTSQGTFERTPNVDMDLVQIVYTRKGGRMIAKEVIRLS